MIGVGLARIDAELVLLALEAFDADGAAPEERRRLYGIMGALRQALIEPVACGLTFVEDDGRVIECRMPRDHPGVWHSDADDGEGRLWRDV